MTDEILAFREGETHMTAMSPPEKRCPAGRQASLLVWVGALVLQAWAALPVAAQEPPPGEAPGSEAPGQSTVAGRLIGPADQAIPGGRVAVLLHEYRRSESPEGTWFPAGLSITTRVWMLGQADAEGRFQLAGPRTSASLPPAGASLVVAAPGFGIVHKTLDHAAARHEVTIALEPERFVRGRLIDLQGQPAAGVKVHLLRPDPAFAALWYDRSLEGLLPFWPRPATTDDKGRFLVRGLGRAKVTLDARHPRLAPQHLDVQTLSPEETREVTLSLAPARVLRGRVTYADSRKPAPDTRVLVISAKDEFGMGYQKVEGRADHNGRFALPVFPGEFLAVIAHLPPGTPYLVLREVTPWAAVARQEAGFRLVRGTLVRGTVTEQPSGKPIAGARVQYRARENNNPFYRRKVRGGDMEEYLLQTAVSRADGKFTLAVPPGPGHLLVLGPTLDYVHVATSWGQLEYGTPGRERLYPDGLVAVDLNPKSKEHTVTVSLRRGMTVKGWVLGPDEKPVDQFKVLSRSYIPSGYSWWRRLHVAEGRDGRFELPGCDPEKPLTVYLFDPKNELGATVTVSGKHAAEGHVTIRLERCGTAVARFVTAPASVDGQGAANETGRPLANHAPLPLELVLTPGATRFSFEVGYDDDNKQELEADWMDVPNLGPAQYPKYPNAPFSTNAEGRITFPALIPGAMYRIVHFRPEADKDAAAIRSSGRIKGLPVTDFTAKAGEALVLPDITDVPRSPETVVMPGPSR
jgi:hypothetical protein